MKTKIFFVYLILTISVGILSASNTCVNSICYDFNDITNTASVTSYYSYPNKDLGTVNIPATVSYNNITYSVTSIGDYAFRECSGLISVTIPNSVTSIGEGAFMYCYSLNSVNIPNSVASIGEDAFYSCKSLTSMTIPNSVTSIGDGIFAYCTTLTNIDIAEDNLNYSSIGGVLVNKNKTKLIQYPVGRSAAYYSIPNSITSIGRNAFCGCSSLISIEIHNDVTEIGGGAFSNCTGLTSITIPNGIKNIEESIFSGCKSLTSITIPNSVTSIGYGAFFYCTNLTAIEIPNSVIEIGGEAFYYCTNLTAVEIPNSVTEIGWKAFFYCTNLNSIEIPNGVTEIKNETFNYCYNLGSITIPNSVTSIGYGAFSNCTSLQFIAIPNSVIYINPGAFGGIPLVVYSGEAGGSPWGAEEHINPGGLIEGDWIYADDSKHYVIGYLGYDENVIIPSGVTTIGEKIIAPYSWYNEDNLNIRSLEISNVVKDIKDSAFYNCPNLSKITCYAKRIPKITEHSFGGIDKSSCILYVLADYLDSYVQDYFWGDFVDIRPIGASTIQTDTISINPEETTATVVWPSVSGAATYELVIKDKEGNVVCTLIFNAQGQLTSIAFAPSRNNAPQQTQTAGFSFTVTGLEEGTGYDLTITSKNESGVVLDEKTISFFTNGGNAIDDVYSESIPSIKTIRNGQVVIQRGEKVYTLTGQEVK